MNWFVWRQHRKTMTTFTILLIAFAAFAIPTGNHFWHAYQHALVTCAQHPNTPSCSDLAGSLFQGDGAIFDAVILTGFAVPILLGLFLGSPLLAKEYEEGTNKLIWTQSVSRRKWLTTKVAWALGFAALYGLAITLLITWWSRTLNTLNLDRFDTGEFDIQGLMPFAYSIFFTAVGLTMGAWFRRTLVALGVTLSLFVLCMAAFGQWIRPHYMTPITVTSQVGPNMIESKIPTGAWILSRRNLVNPSGKEVSFDVANFPTACQQLTMDTQVPSGGHVAKIKAEGIDPVIDCLNRSGFHETAKYQPASRYWDFQRIEAAIYLGLTAMLIGSTYWLVLRRDA